MILPSSSVNALVAHLSVLLDLTSRCQIKSDHLHMVIQTIDVMHSFRSYSALPSKPDEQSEFVGIVTITDILSHIKKFFNSDTKRYPALTFGADDSMMYINNPNINIGYTVPLHQKDCVQYPLHPIYNAHGHSITLTHPEFNAVVLPTCLGDAYLYIRCEGPAVHFGTRHELGSIDVCYSGTSDCILPRLVRCRVRNWRPFVNVHSPSTVTICEDRCLLSLKVGTIVLDMEMFHEPLP